MINIFHYHIKTKNYLIFIVLFVPRQVTSQHPYAEEFIAQPHVHTVDIGDLKEVERVVAEALAAFDEGKVC